MDISKGFKFRLESGLDPLPQNLKKWNGHAYMGKDPGRKIAIPIISDVLQTEQPERVYQIMRGDRNIVASPHDFSKSIQDDLRHQFVLPEDKNKHMVWLTDKWPEQQKWSVIWLLRKSRHYNDDSKQISDAIEFIKKIAKVYQNGIDILDLRCVENEMPGFLEWLDSIGLKWATGSNKRFYSMTLISMLVVDDAGSMLSDVYKNKIATSLHEYSKQPDALQRLSRRNYSKEVTFWINSNKSPHR